jgi:predicted GIY-YIG superfamily endonuclease
MMDEYFKKIYPNLTLIPDEILDGFDLEQEFSVYQLHRLYDVIGLNSIISAVISQQKRYPGTKLFVSKLRKQHKKNIQGIFYENSHQNWIVYLLVTLDHRFAKVGISTNITKRAFDLSGGNFWQTDPRPIQFDMDESLVISGFNSKKDALAVEKSIKNLTIDALCDPPDWTCFLNAKTEWRIYSDNLIRIFRSRINNNDNLKILSAFDYAESNPKVLLIEKLPIR